MTSPVVLMRRSELISKRGFRELCSRLWNRSGLACARREVQPSGGRRSLWMGIERVAHNKPGAATVIGILGVWRTTPVGSSAPGRDSVSAA